MTWTKSGTVSLTNNSAIVYGAGTTWVSGGKTRAGDVFVAPSGALYEVASIQSNTQLTLASAYLGSTASAQSYALIHTGLLPAELAVSLSDLQSKYLTTISQLYDWETSGAATVNLTNPATGVTAAVKTITQMIADLASKATAANPLFTGVARITDGVLVSHRTSDTGFANYLAGTNSDSSDAWRIGNMGGGNSTSFVNVKAAPLELGTSNAVRVTIDANGCVYHGGMTSTPYTGFQGVGLTVFRGPGGAYNRAAIFGSTDAGAATVVGFANPNGEVGNVTTSGTSTAYGTSSDYRLKDNVELMQGALEKNARLRPVTYTWKVDGSSGQGFIAHELAEVFPDAVTGEKDATRIIQHEVTPAMYESVVIPALIDGAGNVVMPERTEMRLVTEAVTEDREVPAYQGIDTSFLVGHLVACVQELTAEVVEVRARLSALEAA